jgi:hypothetical protein
MLFNSSWCLFSSDRIALKSSLTLLSFTLGSVSVIFPMSSASICMCFSIRCFCVSRCACVRALEVVVKSVRAEVYMSPCFTESSDIPLRTPFTAGFSTVPRDLLRDCTILFSIFIWSLMKVTSSVFVLRIVASNLQLMTSPCMRIRVSETTFPHIVKLGSTKKISSQFISFFTASLSNALRDRFLRMLSQSKQVEKIGSIRAELGDPPGKNTGLGRI